MKHRKGLKRAGIVLAVLALFWTVVNVIPPKKNVEENPFVVAKGQLPMLAAHRGGGINHPENTMLAFREAVNSVGVDIIESDLWMTKDGFLVYNHDEYIDRTCDVNGDISKEEMEAICEDETRRHNIADLTMGELQQYNFGYWFENEQQERIYKDAEDIVSEGLQIAAADALFEEFYESHPNLLFIVEIKNGGDLGKEACRVLSETLEKYPAYQNRIVVGTFHGEIEQELKDHYPHLMRGASVASVAPFVITQYLGVNLFNPSDFACLQLPTSYDVGIEIPLDAKTLVRRAHRRNIAVQYWTINDEATMRQLIEMGCDAIMTDDILLLKEVLESYR